MSRPGARGRPAPGDWEVFGYPPSRPLEVEGGIKAQSKRGAIGERWWSRRFIDVLEAFGMQSRLARGKRYARAGQVLNLEISAGYVTAQVQGSRPRPYRVRLQLLPLTTGQWRRVERQLASQALFRAKLLAGEMPAEIEEVFDACGTPLFPHRPRDMQMSCSCPDWGVPCKHVAAVCYLLAESFDADPFGILAWRGRSRDDLLAALRRRNAPAARAASGPGRAAADVSPAGSAGPAAGQAQPAGRAGTTPLIDGPVPPLAGCLDDFWSPALSSARLRALPAVLATTPDLLLRMFEPPPVRVRGRDLVTLLGPAYQRMAAADDLLSEDVPG